MLLSASGCVWLLLSGRPPPPPHTVQVLYPLRHRHPQAAAHGHRADAVRHAGDRLESGWITLSAPGSLRLRRTQKHSVGPQLTPPSRLLLVASLTASASARTALQVWRQVHVSAQAASALLSERPAHRPSHHAGHRRRQPRRYSLRRRQCGRNVASEGDQRPGAQARAFRSHRLPASPSHLPPSSLLTVTPIPCIAFARTPSRPCLSFTGA